MARAKMIWYCHDCGMVLRLWQIRCPNCHRSGMSLLQVAVIAIVALPALFLLIRLF
jgi:predicted ATP-dependent serine protease